jgi:hypothetical protein
MENCKTPNSTAPKKPDKIVSGGQTGADRAGLEWALTNYIPHGGWCPRGRRSEDGVIPEAYTLVETISKGYGQRTKRNVIDSNLTIIVTAHAELEGGSKKTADFAEEFSRPLVHIHAPLTPTQIQQARQVIMNTAARQGNLVVNVAGTRESKSPGIGHLVQTALNAIFNLGQGLRVYLDDLRPLPHEFDVNPKTSEEAIHWLQICRIAQLSLDHDLGETACGTGYDVALWIEQAAHDGELEPLAWKVHSANPVGREKIHLAMKSAEKFWRKAAMRHKKIILDNPQTPN